MIWRVLADTVLILHLLFVIFVVLGGWLVAWRPKLIWAHLPVARLGHLDRVLGRDLPADAARELAAHAWRGGRLLRRIHRALPDVVPLSRGADAQDTQFLLGGILIAINLAAYGMLWHWRRRKKV